MQKTILLTGASGFFGREINKKLKNYYNILTPNSKKLNLLRKQSITKYLKNNKIDIIINSAWKLNSTLEKKKIQTENYYKNIKMANNLIEFSQKFLIKNFLNISSINVYFKQEKKLLEKNLLKSKSNQSNKFEGKAKLLIIKRFKTIKDKEYQYKNLLFSHIYGFNNKKKNLLLIDKLFHNQYLKKKYKIIKNKKNIIKIDYLYIDDATNAVKHFLKVLLKKKFNCDFLNIGSGHSHKINDVINQIQGKENIKNNNLMIESHKMQNLIPSISLAKKYGWKPQCELKTGLKKTRNNYKKFKDKFS